MPNKAAQHDEMMIPELFNHANWSVNNVCCEYKSGGEDGFLSGPGPCNMIYILVQVSQ